MSIVASENAGLGPREINLSVDQWITDSLPPNTNSNTSNASASLLSQQQQQQSHQSKIMNVVVPNVACPPTAAKKIRRKPENKPQSQINKCNNEKRRRELENEYIEQLGEFLQINKRDMTACKPDKAAILSEVVKKFRNLLEQRSRDTPTQQIRCNKCPPGCSDTCTLHPVQQGEVSSTEPPLPEPSVNGHSPEKSAYFEAVQHYIRNVGWALLEINSEGFIECATENVIDVLHYSRQELSGQSIYSYLHTGDHNKVSPILDKNSFSFEWDQDDGPSFPQTPKRTVRIRWLLKSPEETIEQKQQRPNRYKDLLIISAPVKDDSDESSSVLCLITLPEDDQSMDPTMPPANEQLTIRIDAEGKIIKVDTSQLRPHFVSFLTKEIGHKIEELVHPSDHQRLKMHLKEVIHGQSDAQITNYRILLAPDCYVHAKVQSRMFRSDVQGEPDFVMAVHEILSDSEVMALDGGSFSGMLSMQPNTSHSMMSHQLQKHNQGALGGPLMTSVINGNPLSQISPRNGQNSLMNDNNSLLHPPTSNDNYFNPDTFDFDFPSTTFEIENSWAIDSRPESRTSLASASTPRPSSATAVFSPATAPMCPSPLTPYHNSQPSPASITNNNNTNMTNNNLANSGGGAGGSNNINGSSGFNSAGSNSSSNFPFSFDDKEKEQFQKLQENSSSSSDRLRNLLMKSPSGSGLDASEQERARNQILKTLLNAEDDKDNTLTHKFNPSSISNRMPLQRPRSTTSESKNNNNMLLQLLNDKSDDDDSNSKQHSELLKRLQNPSKDDHKELNNNAEMDNEALKRQLRFQGGPGLLENNRKRASDESDDSSSGNSKRPSKLQEKNKMLASLLACPSRPINSPNLTLPAVRMMPDIPTQHKGRPDSGLPSPLGNQPATPNQQTSNSKNTNNNNNSTKNNNIKSAQAKFRAQPQGQMRNMPGGNVKVGEQIYLSQIQNQQMQQQQQIATGRAALSSMLATSQANSTSQGSFDGQQFVSSSPSITSAPASSSTIQQQEWDPELNDILENVIEFDESNFCEEAMTFQQMNANASAQLKQQEELALINKIQMSLMECENEDNFTGSPPAYPLHNIPAQNRLQQGYQPPPGYNQRNIRLPMNVTSNNVVTNSNTATVAQATNSQQANKQPNALMLQRIQMQQHQQRILQQQQKERLLQQQQNQSIVVTAGADQLCLSNPGVQSIDSLLNNTVAPNVTLTSRGPVVPDSQLSPNFSQSLMQQQLSPNQQRGNTPFSPQANQNFQQNPFNANGGQRLSPQQQQINQQLLLNNFQQGNSSNSNGASQLSPRQPPFTQQSTNPAQSNPANWNQQTPANNIRLNLQQNNPMLNAQLSQQQQNVNAFANQRQFSAQRQRSLNSPGTPVSRQSSFNSQDSFPEPPSPSAAQQQYNSTIFNHQQLRLQRQQSIPQATQHLPGSPRPFGPGLPDGPSGYGINGMNMYNALGGNDFYGRVNQTGGPNNGLNPSQMVRQGLRAVVSGRTQQTNVGSAVNANNGSNNIRRNLSSPLDPMGPNSGALGDANTNNNNPNNNLMISQQQQQQQQQQQLPGNIMNTSSDLDSSMRFGFNIPEGTTNVDTKLTAPPLATQWSGNSNNSRIILEERAGDQKNSSLLLQKLLSD